MSARHTAHPVAHVKARQVDHIHLHRGHYSLAVPRRLAREVSCRRGQHTLAKVLTTAVARVHATGGGHSSRDGRQTRKPKRRKEPHGVEMGVWEDK